MHQDIIAAHGAFKLVSLGDGLGYELIRNDGKSIFVRGDKAKQFERDWTYLKACYPFGPTRLILQKLWEIYA